MRDETLNLRLEPAFSVVVRQRDDLFFDAPASQQNRESPKKSRMPKKLRLSSRFVDSENSGWRDPKGMYPEILDGAYLTLYSGSNRVAHWQIVPDEFTDIDGNKANIWASDSGPHWRIKQILDVKMRALRAGIGPLQGKAMPTRE